MPGLADDLDNIRLERRAEDCVAEWDATDRAVRGGAQKAATRTFDISDGPCPVYLFTPGVAGRAWPGNVDIVREYLEKTTELCALWDPERQRFIIYPQSAQATAQAILGAAPAAPAAPAPPAAPADPAATAGVAQTPGTVSAVLVGRPVTRCSAFDAFDANEAARAVKALRCVGAVRGVSGPAGSN